MVPDMFKPMKFYCASSKQEVMKVFPLCKNSENHLDISIHVNDSNDTKVQSKKILTRELDQREYLAIIRDPFY